jgi:drug/metabolite transporter (DMT)-like permease
MATPNIVRRDADYRKGLSLAVAGGLLLTLDAPTLRLVNGDASTVIFWRGLMLFAVTAGIWYWARQTDRIHSGLINGPDGLLVIGLHTAAGLSFLFALHLSSVANVLFIIASVPLITAVLSVLILRESIRPATWTAAGIVVAAVFIIVADGLQHGSGKGDFLALIAAVAVSCALIVTRRTGNNYATAPGVAGLFCAALIFAFADVAPMDTGQWGWLTLNSVLIAPLSFVLLVLAPRYMAPAESSIYYLLETAAAPIWVWLMIGELPTSAGLLGGIIILVTLAAHGYLALARGPRRRTEALAGKIPVN